MKNGLPIESLEFISVYIDDNQNYYGHHQSHSVIVNVVRALIDVIAKQKKQRMKIRINVCKKATKFDEEFFEEVIFELIDNLDRNVKNWMIILEDMKRIFDQNKDVEKRWIDLL